MKETGLTFEGCIGGGGVEYVCREDRIQPGYPLRNHPLPRPVYPYGYPLRKLTGPLYQRMVFQSSI
jgi:hypothetical protein